MAITSGRSPSQTPSSGVGTALTGGADSATKAFNTVYSPTRESSYSVVTQFLDLLLMVAESVFRGYTLDRAQCLSIPDPLGTTIQPGRAKYYCHQCPISPSLA